MAAGTIEVLKGGTLKEVTAVPVRVGVSGLDATAEIETWLQTQVEPGVPLLWKRRPVRNTVELTDRVAALGLADWGVLETQSGFPWAQAMRVEGGFVVEVCGDGGPQSWARRVYPIGSLGPDGPRVRSKAADVRPGVPTGTSHLDGENIPTASGAAQVLWAWLHGGLPAGYALRNVTRR